MLTSRTFQQDGKFTSEFDTLVTETIKRWNVPGISFAVIERDSAYTNVGTKLLSDYF
jgi:hypothetical protein